MIFTWTGDGHTERRPFGNNLEELLHRGNKPDLVDITYIEIDNATRYGCFSDNKWDAERYIRDKFTNVLNEDGEISIVNQELIRYYPNEVNEGVNRDK